MAEAAAEPRRVPTAYFRRFFAEFIAPHRAVVALLVVNILVRVGLGLWWPQANRLMVDRVLTSDRVEWHVGAVIIGVGLCILFANSLLVYLFNRVLYRLLVVVTQRTRTVIADHLLRLSQRFYDSAHAGRLLMTAVGDPGAITNVMTAGMINTLANALIVLSGFSVLLTMNVQLTLAITPVFLGMVGAFFWLRPKIRRSSEVIRESWGILSGMVSEKVVAVRVVRSFAAEDVETERFARRVFLHRDYNVQNNVYVTVYGFVNGLLIHLGFMIVFVAGGLLYFRGRTTLGTVVAFYGYFQTLFPAVQEVCNLPQLIVQASGSMTKVFRLLDEPLTIASPAGAPRLDEPFREVVLEDVSFRYAPDLPWAVRHLSLTVRAGERVGIVGPSGSGKSTLLALMLRYYDPTEGRVLVNGRDLKDWDLGSVRQAFGLVPQDVILFSGSIRENVVYTRGDRDDAAIWRALGRAEAAAFVKGLDRGLEAELGEGGVSLSGGQKQRLSIARALLSDPQLLVLDNCTSALDGETEQRLLGALREVMAGRTALTVSHRVASVTGGDRVVVMNQGRIIEEGRPKDLLAAGGYFAEIFTKQGAGESA